MCRFVGYERWLVKIAVLIVNVKHIMRYFMAIMDQIERLGLPNLQI